MCMNFAWPKGKNIVCVFAHPDDEAFGPGGTIYKLARDNDVYIICATSGDAGENRSRIKDKPLGEIRAAELQQSAKILGVKKVFFLGFYDGTLSNNLYHQLAKAIEEIVVKLKPEILLTAEPLGVSGHIDHIVVSLTTTYVFKKLKSVEWLLYHCLDESHRLPFMRYFIYFPPGYKHEDIDLMVDTADIWEKKIEAMKKHQSQVKDIRRIIARYKKLSKTESFLVKNHHDLLSPRP